MCVCVPVFNRLICLAKGRVVKQLNEAADTRDKLIFLFQNTFHLHAVLHTIASNSNSTNFLARECLSFTCFLYFFNFIVDDICEYFMASVDKS